MMRWAVFAATALALSSAPVAHAQSDLFSPNTFSAVVDARVVAADGEASWIDGGFGKARWGDESGLRLAEVGVAWRPRLSDAVSATVTLDYQDGADPQVDVGEAYLTARGVVGGWRLSGKAGLYWPQVSLEHDGVFWSVPDTITPSAINSWMGEEGKVVGAETTVRGDVGGASVAATVGVFGGADTAGTLLAFRGWALHDLKNSAESRMPLPPLSPYMASRQAQATTSITELDDRTGVYGRLEWSPTDRLTLDLFGWDNRASPTAMNLRLDWGWETHFVNLGATWRPDDRTRVRAQILSGETAMGYPDRTDGAIWVDVGFSAAYLSVSRELGPGVLTGRVDLFDTDDRTHVVADNNDEEGHALTGAYRWDLSPGTALVFEALRIESDRPSRAQAGETPDQVQTVVQTALRFEL